MPACCGQIKKKDGDKMVEFDAYKYTLGTFTKPLQELRDSL